MNALPAADFLPLIYITYAGAAERSLEGTDINFAKEAAGTLGTCVLRSWIL